MTALILALLIASAVLLVAEAHAPAYGVLGVAGVAALAGALILAVTASGGSVALAVGLAAPVVAGAGATAAVAVRKTRAASRRRARCGADGLIGHVGVVRRTLDPTGHVFVNGELWRARRSWADEDGPAPAAGEEVVVERVSGLTLSVRRAEGWEVEP